MLSRSAGCATIVQSISSCLLCNRQQSGFRPLAPPRRDLLPGLQRMQHLEELQLDTDAVLAPGQLELLSCPPLPASLQHLFLQPGQEPATPAQRAVLESALRRQLPGVAVILLACEVH